MRAALSVLAATLPLAGQLPPHNTAGVTAGHHHIRSAGIETHRKFWADVLGGTTVKLGPMDMVKGPGLLVLLQKMDSKGGSEGCVVGHVAVRVRDRKAVFERARQAGYAIQGSNVTGPDGVVVEVIEDPSLSAPLANHHIHFYTTEVLAMRDWYVKTFGATPGKRGKFDAADLPGVNLTFSESAARTAGTRGRALDHIGFEVRQLEDYCKKLASQGVKFDVPYRKLPALGIAIAFLTDPWGTYIELTEGLDRY